MSQLEATPEPSEYRLVLLSSGSHATWGERMGSDIRLPRIALPRWTRQAQQLQKRIAEAWGLRGIVLEVLSRHCAWGPCAVVEILKGACPRGLTALRIDEISEEELTLSERKTVDAMLVGDSGSRGPFSRVGWIREAEEWLQASLGVPIARTEQIHQFNATGHFALVRFAIEDRSAYWLKATGEPNTHEFQITKMLAKLCPEFLPRCIAARADWNAWLMEDAGIAMDPPTLPRLEQAILSMATLQKTTIGYECAFLAARAFDQRISVMRAQLVELIEYLDEAMKKQISTKAPRIENNRLRQIGDLLQDACFRMEALMIPDTLAHNDVNSGNILFDGKRCVFTDWCEVGVGNPFLTFEYLCLLQPRDKEDWTSELQKVYRHSWLDTLSASQIDRAFALAPLLAVLCYLHGRGTWLGSSRRNAPEVEGHARALARRLDREAQDPRLLEALCQ
jgi:hypothetical protein